MDQSHRPGRWVQIFVLVSLICGVNQICSLAQNETQPASAPSEGSTQGSSTDTMPDISGVWTETQNFTPNSVTHTYYITAAPDGASHQYHWFRDKTQSSGLVKWLPKQRLFELTGFVNSPNYKVLAEPLADREQIRFYSNDKNDLDWSSILSRLASNETTGEVLKDFSVTSLDYRKQFGRKESPGLILTETPEGIAAYSRALGRWDKIQIPIPKGHRPRILDFEVNPTFAAAAIDDQLIGYGAARGLWSKKTIPADLIGKVKPVLIGDAPYAQVGNNLYILSSTTGEWTSPDDPVAKADALSPVEPSKGVNTTIVGLSNPRPTPIGQPSIEPTATAQDFRFSFGTDATSAGTPVAAVPQSPLDSVEAKALSQRLTSQEQSTAVLAEQLRKQSGTLGNDHPTTKSLRAQLASALSAALDLKFELELLQVKQMQSQLSRLQEQIGQRKAQRQKIIDRRINELIEDDSTKWNNGPAVSTTSSRRGRERDVATKLTSAESTAEELFDRGMAYRKRGLRQAAYNFFKAASESGQTLDAVRAQQLKEFLREMGPINEAVKTAPPTAFGVDEIYGTIREPQQKSETRILIRGPGEMQITAVSTRTGEKQLSSLPYLLTSPADSRLEVKFATHDGVKFQGTLAISPIKSHTKFFWDQNDIPLGITTENLYELTSGKAITKVVYLNEAGIRNHALARAEAVESTDLKPGFDPVAEADRRGAILMTLKLALSNERPTSQVPAAGKTAVSSTERSVGLAQSISFSGPDGVKICTDPWKGPSQSYVTQPLPHVHRARRPSDLQPEWKFFLPVEQTVFGTLYVSPVKTQTRSYWLSNTVPLTITREDLSDVARGELVTKVVYLSEDSIRNPKNAVAETLETTGLASENPVEEADRRGAVLAVLHLSPKELSPQVRVTGPQGLSVLLQPKNWRRSLPLTLEELPNSGSQHSLEFTSQANQKFYGSLGVFSVRGHTQFFWQTQVPQIEITQDEIDKLATTGIVTKAYYLSENSIRNPSQAQLESIDSLTSPPGTDVVTQADVRGAVLAVLKIAPTREHFTLPWGITKASSGSTSTEQKFQQNVLGGFEGPDAILLGASTVAPPPITGTPINLDASNIDAVVRLRNAQAAVKTAQKQLELVEKRSPVSEKQLKEAKLELDRATRQQENLLEEVRFSLRDLELQLESANAETELLAQEQRNMESLSSAARATPSEVGSARLKYTKSKSALERLKHRFEYFQQAIQDQKAEPSQERKDEHSFRRDDGFKK